MKKLYEYGIYCIVLILCLVGFWWCWHSIVELRMAYINRVKQLVIMRDQWQQCKQVNYKRVADDYASAHNFVCESSPLDETIWSVVGSESYGPQREVKKKSRCITLVQPKKRSHKVLNEVASTEALTHRGAPFSLPLEKGSFWLSSRFGPRARADGSAGFHYGVDLAANRGTRVHASRAGVVVYAGYDSGYGKTIVLKHGSHFKTRYAHLDKILVKAGDMATRGSVIGAVGATGYIRKKGGDGSHLHFEIFYHGKRVDPLQFLPDFVS